RSVVRHGEGGGAGRFIGRPVLDVQRHRRHAQANQGPGGRSLCDRKRRRAVTVRGHYAAGEVGHRRLADAIGKSALIGGAGSDRSRSVVRHGEGGGAGRFIGRPVLDVQRDRCQAQANQGAGGRSLSDRQRRRAVTVRGHHAAGEIGHRRLADAIGKSALIGGAGGDGRRSVVGHGEGGGAGRLVGRSVRVVYSDR